MEVPFSLLIKKLEQFIRPCSLFIRLISNDKKANTNSNYTNMVTGIDCSKDFLDLVVLSGEKVQFSARFANHKDGFEALLQYVKDSHVAMEATGPYYLPLAMFLEQNQVKVSVVNPLVIKRFSQMRMSRTKTDQKDAMIIAQYTQKENPTLWKCPNILLLSLQQLETYLDSLKVRRAMLGNQLHAFESSGVLQKDLAKEISEELQVYDDRIKSTETKITVLIDQWYGQLKENLKSIPGIGERSATLMIIKTNGFENFDNYRQVISYFGLSPRIFQSGTSVKGKAKICKMGMSQVRRTLYMAANSASRFNKACKELYDRLRAKGKPFRVAIIAVVNKLIKQAFAIAKSNIAYRADFESKKLTEYNLADL